MAHEKLLQVETDDDDEKELSRHKIVELEAGKRTEWDLACPICKAAHAKVRYFGGLVTPVKEPRQNQPAQAKAVFFCCQNGHNFIVLVSGEVGAGVSTAALVFGDEVTEAIKDKIGAMLPPQTAN